MKKALVTGSSQGIGSAIARALHQAGYKVFINYLKSEAQAAALAKELDSIAIQCDVSDPSAVREMLKTTGDIDLLVNNAGIGYSGLLTDMTDDAAARIMAVNAGGAINCCRAAIPGMVRKKQGVIINISSVCGVCGSSCETVYSTSKAALIGLTRALSKELGLSGIRVNAIAPGLIDTRMVAGLSAADKSSLVSETPLNRIGTPEDVAAAAVFLASESASFITGQILGTDGGLTL